MYKLASCLLFIGFLNPLLSLPVTDSSDMSPQLSAGEDSRLTLDMLERASLLRMRPEMLSAQRGNGLGEADPSTNTFNPRGTPRKFQAFSEQDLKVLLSHLLAGTRKQYKKHGIPSECFWKYCV
ncbi:PREDICTED: urotensin-2 [Chrysochloris asiatica]|uniref:Urotensin-2 n=1 Tax=Chrysochloris asiatica TaxID=185453 RepID=A0A9B0WWZ5_CHRAS|nr:PREDICTED: urotensin-2 [Chrysochloris asiatica]